MSPTDVRSPGGWLNLLNSRITRWLVVGALATTGGGGAVAIYGQFQGAQASFVCEARLVTATKGTVSYSCLNPLPNGMSGAVLGVPSNVIVVAGNTAPATRVNICTAATASTACSGDADGTNVGSGIILGGAKRILSISQTGSTLVQVMTSSGAYAGGYNSNNPVKTSLKHGTPFTVLAPRNYGATAKKYLNFTLQRGSGATTTGLAPAFARFEIVPCNVSGVGC